MEGRIVTTAATSPGTEITQVIRDHTMEQWVQMSVGIPDADDSEALDNILSALLNADSIDAFNAPWDTAAGEKLAGHKLRIESIAKRASDFADGLGIYLVAKGVDLSTGEPLTWATSAIAVVATLTRVHYLGQLPVIGELIVADKPTKRGYRPQHFQVLTMEPRR